MPQPIQLRIFLSSPGDVADERGLALQVIDRLAYDPLLRGKVTLEAVAWDKPGAGAPMLATMTPQQAVNDGLPKPSQCDIVIVIFWARMGTPLPDDYAKSDGSRFLSGTEWEYEDAMQAALTDGKPDVIVYRRTEDILLKPTDSDFMAKYEQWNHVEAFFKHFLNPDGSIKQGYNAYKTPDEFRGLLEHHLKAIISRHLEKRASTDPAPPQPDVTIVSPPLWQGSPFPGLRAFTPDDAPIFFGRGHETDELVARLNNADVPFVSVIGASGSGKSSLVGAGLIPRLHANAIVGSKDWVVLRFTPGSTDANPFAGLVSAIATVFSDINESDLLHQLESDPESIEALGQQLLADDPQWAELILFVDQFEELFTLVSPHYREPFIQLLSSAQKRVRVIVTLRADFYRQCVEYAQLAQLLRIGSYPLATPGIGALYEMIDRPATLAGLEFEDGLIQRILDDTGDDAGALALLAYTLDELYRAADGSGQLTHHLYDELGGVQGAIAQRAESTYKSLDPDAQARLPHVFRELVSVNDDGVATRRRVPFDQVTKTDGAARLVNALTDSRLLVQSHEDGQAVVEVAHEALLRSWTLLIKWIDDMGDDLRLLRQLRHAVQLWEQHNRSDDFRWVGKRVQAAVAMCKILDPMLTDAEKDFITPENNRLLDEIRDINTVHYRRALIGERLHEITDSRDGIGVFEDGSPDFMWCDVPAGSINLNASKTQAQLTFTDAQLTFKVKPFRIAKYQVTFGQFRAFIEANDGYDNPQWWEGIGTHSKIPAQPRPFDNHPVEFVSWYDAVAFCRWASERLGFRIRLPTEWEWLQAATGGDSDNKFTWGKGWNPAMANTRESDLLRTTAVGMYPQSTAPVGATDMIGNVWEWCTNELENPANVALSSKAKRALKGGSCLSRNRKAILTYRAGNIPSKRNEAHGFRVCVPILEQ
jgi:formylglycine-generating enzyme required for sulfatase activity